MTKYLHKCRALLIGSRCRREISCNSCVRGFTANANIWLGVLYIRWLETTTEPRKYLHFCCLIPPFFSVGTIKKAKNAHIFQPHFTLVAARGWETHLWCVLLMRESEKNVVNAVCHADVPSAWSLRWRYIPRDAFRDAGNFSFSPRARVFWSKIAEKAECHKN